MKWDKDKIKTSLTVDDIDSVLKDLGSQSSKKDNQGNLIYQTICHNINNGSYKLYYYKESSQFHCYTGCGESFDIYDLVLKAKRLKGSIWSFNQAVSYIANLTGKRYISTFDLNDDKPYIIDDWDFIDSYKVRKRPKIELPIYDGKVLEVFRYLPHSSWLDEGISWETMKRFNISYYIKDDKIVIPHYNINGDLVGIRGRALKDEDIENGKKYMPLIVGGKLYNHPTAFNLYGLNLNKENIKKYKTAIIFEGEKSVMKSEEYYKNCSFAVAVGGNNISEIQRDMLLELGINNVIIAFDKQYEDVRSKEAKVYAKKLRGLADKFINYCNVYVLWDTEDLLPYKSSPIDKGKEAFEKLFKNKIEITNKVNIEVNK